MKISFVTPALSNITGGTRVIAIYAEHLKRRGHEVHVISYTSNSLKKLLTKNLTSLIKGKGWPKLNKNRDFLSSFYKNLDISYKLVYGTVTDADCPDADVVIATWWHTAYWVAELSAAKGAKAYYMQDYGAPGQELENLIPTWLLPLHKITLSQWLVDLIHKHCGDIPVSLVNCAVDCQKFQSPPRSKQSRPTVGVVNRNMYSKGLDIVAKAIKIAHQEIPEIQLLMFGSEELDPNFIDFPNKINYCRVSDEQIKNIYSSCDAWLFPSRQEGFGLPILEAMACRTPVIGTPAGAAPELLVDGAGILVKPEDPEDMAKAIIQICQLSQDEWRTMSDAAYAVATNYTWEDAADLFEQALYTAIERSQSGKLS